jgi:hypothetical protein
MNALLRCPPALLRAVYWRSVDRAVGVHSSTRPALFRMPLPRRPAPAVNDQRLPALQERRRPSRRACGVSHNSIDHRACLPR